jgi:putative Ca2+/H+ antiporter (TMEM165/GDT1 family)
MGGQGEMMVDLSLNDIYKSIGALTVEVQGLRRDMEASERRAALENREAGEKRAVVHRRMDEIVAEVGDIKTDIATITGQVKDSKAVADQVKQWKLMGLGALGVVGTALGVTLASSVEWVAKLFHK